MTKLLIKLLASQKSRYAQIILYKSYADLMSEGSRYYIGYLWWLIEPIIDMGVYYVIFGLVLHNRSPEFIPFLLTGTVIWRWLQSTTMMGAASIYAYRPLMDQVYVPKVVFPTVTIITNTFKFALVFGVLILFLLLYGYRIDAAWSALPVMFGVGLLVITSLTYLFAAVVPFFPDLRIIIDSAFKILLFLSGIFAPLSKMPDGVVYYLRFNPAVHILEGFRAILLHNEWPQWQPLALIATVSTLLTLVGMNLIRRYDTSYPKLSM